MEEIVSVQSYAAVFVGILVDARLLLIGFHSYGWCDTYTDVEILIIVQNLELDE